MSFKSYLFLNPERIGHCCESHADHVFNDCEASYTPKPFEYFYPVDAPCDVCSRVRDAISHDCDDANSQGMGSVYL